MCARSGHPALAQIREGGGGSGGVDMMWFVERAGLLHAEHHTRSWMAANRGPHVSRSRVEGSIEGGDDKRFNEMSRNDSVAVNSA